MGSGTADQVPASADAAVQMVLKALIADDIEIQNVDWDTDDDGRLENQGVEAFANFASGDEFDGYPLQSGDLSQLDGSITSIEENTNANRPSAGTEGRIFFESDTGKVLYDDGASWVDLGLSEDQISLANLSSRSITDLSDVSGVTAFEEDTSGNRPSAGTEGRIFVESDTGRVLYDDGASWVEMGLSESQISLANLGSRSHSDLSDAPSSAHHTKTTDMDDLNDVTGITSFEENTNANRPSAGTEGRIFFESDTGKVLYDDGASWVDLGLSEDQISLANLSSRAHSDLSDAPASAHHPESESDTATASGDGSTTTFTLSHNLGSTPTAVSVQPTSADAAGDFHVSSKSSTSIDVTYASAPASGTDNLTWDIITHA